MKGGAVERRFFVALNAEGAEPGLHLSAGPADCYAASPKAFEQNIAGVVI
jgi:hypothetical protein